MRFSIRVITIMCAISMILSFMVGCQPTEDQSVQPTVVSTTDSSFPSETTEGHTTRATEPVTTVPVLENPWSRYFEQNIDTKNLTEAFGKYDNMPLEHLTAHSYKDYVDYVPNYIIIPVFSGSDPMSYEHRLEQFHEKFPIEHMIQLLDTRVCMIFKVEHKNGQQAYVYQFARNGAYGWNASEEHYFVSKTLCYEDFSNIKEGDTLQEVYDIDPAMIFDISGQMTADPKHNQYVIRRLLSDGILEMAVKMPPQEEPSIKDVGHYTLEAVSFHPFSSTDSGISGTALPMP